MDLTKLLTEINTYLPGYDIRIFFLLFLICTLLLNIGLLLISRKFTKKIWSFLPSFLLLLIYLSFPFILHFFGYTYERFLSLEYLSLSSTYLLLLLCEILFLIFLSLRKEVTKIFFWIQISISILSLILILVISTFSESKISSLGANKEGILEEASGVSIYFSVPMNKKNLDIHISPETEIQISYGYVLNSSKWITSFKVQPKESFLPNQKVVIYTTGITRLFPYGTKHENSQEFFTPKTPVLEQVVLGADINNVPINEKIYIDLDSKDQQFVEWEPIFEPEVEYEIKRDSSERVEIVPLNLKQGTQYKLSLYRNIIKYNTQTLEKISLESHELLNEYSFKTIPAPGLTGFNRDNRYISNKEPLILTFESPLKEDSLNGKININPQVEGDISLSEDKKQVIFKPKSEFTKNTEYTVTIGKGITNTMGGYIEEDINIAFKTPGYVKLSSSSPWNGAKDINIATKSISLTFDQPVNKESVEKLWSISPSINGSFSWKDNTVYYTLEGNLGYGTKYTVTLPAGVVSIYGLNSAFPISFSFTTKHETVRLNVPQYYQSESFTCNLAATRMVLAYKGISSSEGGIRDSIGIGENPLSSWVNGYGVHAGPISSYISSRGVSNSVRSGMSLTSALQEVKEGHPVLVYVYNGYSQPYGAFELPGGFTGYKGMHSEVIVGYVGKPESPISIYTNDPWRGPRTYTPGAFLSKWAYLGYTGIVIY